MVIEIWGQDSSVKGLRLIRFERTIHNRLIWLGPLGEADNGVGVYSQMELEENNWQFIEYMDR